MTTVNHMMCVHVCAYQGHVRTQVEVLNEYHLGMKMLLIVMLYSCYN